MARSCALSCVQTSPQQVRAWWPCDRWPGSRTEPPLVGQGGEGPAPRSQGGSLICRQAAKCESEIEQKSTGMCLREGSIILDQVTGESATFPIPLSPSLLTSTEMMT